MAGVKHGGRPATHAFESTHGVVASFDETRGLGVIESADGTKLPFHCTAITDGTRTISEGERVRFVVTPGPAGRWEATQVEPG